MEKFDNKALENEINKIIMLANINFVSFPYIFVVTDNNRLKKYFLNRLKSETKVKLLYTYSLNYGLSQNIYEELNKNNVLLCDIETKYEELKERIIKENLKINPADSFYMALVMPREIIYEKNHFIIIVLNEMLATTILRCNNSLSSVSYFSFLDDYLKKDDTKKKKVKKK